MVDIHREISTERQPPRPPRMISTIGDTCRVHQYVEQGEGKQKLDFSSDVFVQCTEMDQIDADELSLFSSTLTFILMEIE